MKLSIITVCYNSEKYIRRCIESVFCLNETNYEYIIIDGKSTDTTLEIAMEYVKKFEEKNIPYKIFSEKDSGIYDAMNKGVKKAYGEWILFMNSDDYFYNALCLKKFYGLSLDKFDVIYGDVIVDNGYEKKYQTPRNIKRLKSGIEMPFCHQATFTRKSILERYQFKKDYKIIADIDLFLRLYEDNISFYYLQGCIAVFSNDGLSQTNRIDSMKEGKILLKSHGYYTLDRFIDLNIHIVWYKIKSMLPIQVQKLFCNIRKDNKRKV